MGVDAIVGHHPHVIHPLIKSKPCPTAYSLGNFTYTPGPVPRGAEIRGPYSAVLTLHIRDEEGIVNTTYELAKSVVREDGLSQVIPVRTLLNNASGDDRAIIDPRKVNPGGDRIYPEGPFNRQGSVARHVYCPAFHEIVSVTDSRKQFYGDVQ